MNQSFHPTMMLHALSKGVAQNADMITFLERKGLCVSIRKRKQK
jgi:hypothetical protein